MIGYRKIFRWFDSSHIVCIFWTESCPDASCGWNNQRFLEWKISILAEKIFSLAIQCTTRVVCLCQRSFIGSVSTRCRTDKTIRKRTMKAMIIKHPDSNLSYLIVPTTVSPFTLPRSQSKLKLLSVVIPMTVGQSAFQSNDSEIIFRPRADPIVDCSWYVT